MLGRYVEQSFEGWWWAYDSFGGADGQRKGDVNWGISLGQSPEPERAAALRGAPLGLRDADAPPPAAQLLPALQLRRPVPAALAPHRRELAQDAHHSLHDEHGADAQ